MVGDVTAPTLSATSVNASDRTANLDQAAADAPLHNPETILRFSGGRNASTTNINAGEARRLA